MTDEPRYLVADIGGTNARFAIARGGVDAGFTLENVQRMKSAQFTRLADAARAYLDSCGDGADVARGCFGVAAPIGLGEVRLTNSPWRFDPGRLETELGLERLAVVNDFAALARGAPLTPSGDRVTLAEGEAAETAPVAVLGPGTGLGVGLLVPGPGGPRIVATEGGHAAFAPRDPLEISILEALAESYGYVSSERVLSGSGLVDLYAVLARRRGGGAGLGAPEEVTAAALGGADPIAREAVDVFCAALGGFASDVVVLAGARGGVYLGGGILPRILELLRESAFLARFREKGPMSRYMAEVPVQLIVSDAPALLGAAAIAEAGGV